MPSTINLQARALRWLDTLSWRHRALPAHLRTGLRGEREALFELRRRGYTIVARRWTSGLVRGDADLIAWHGDRLCFVEVKTRTARDNAPAETAVDQPKQEMLRRLARVYVKRFPEKLRDIVLVRFDVVSVYLLSTGVEVEVFPAAFSAD